MVIKVSYRGHAFVVDEEKWGSSPIPVDNPKVLVGHVEVMYSPDGVIREVMQGCEVVPRFREGIYNVEGSYKAWMELNVLVAEINIQTI